MKKFIAELIFIFIGLIAISIVILFILAIVYSMWLLAIAGFIWILILAILIMPLKALYKWAME